MAEVDIALATYNGASFLQEQIESLFAQSFTDWRLIVRDDGSTDGTRGMLERFQTQTPERILLLDDDDGRLGHAQNFGRVLARSDAPYVALCDQDDVWLHDKLRSSLGELQRLEARADAATPCLVFTDATVVDAELRIVAPSFWAHSDLRPADASDLGRMLTGNVAAAHTTVINASLRESAVPVPAAVPFIDWWLALLAAATGDTAFLDEATVLHRQHARNARGARTPFSWGGAVASLRDHRSLRTARCQRFAQAQALRARVAGTIDPALDAVLDAFLQLPELGVVERVRRARRHGLLPADLRRSIVFVMTAPSWTEPVPPHPTAGR